MRRAAATAALAVLLALLAGCGISGEKRAEELPVAAFDAMARALLARG